MADYPMVKLGDLCQIEKGQTGIQSARPGNYPLVTTGPDRKSADSYQFDTAAVCIPLVSSSGHGKKSLNYVHYQEGKFALGTILAAVIPNDSQQLNAAFLQQYLQFFKDRKLVPLMKGAANVSLSMRDIAQIEVPLPPIDLQNKFISIFNRATVFSEQLHQEFATQVAFVTHLRQTILQEAIEGKLTAQWRSLRQAQSAPPGAEPVEATGDPEFDAVVLLAQIKTEKQKLIAEKKIAKENPLPPIRAAEMPFALPEGWVWCRLGEVADNVHYGYTASADFANQDVRLLRITDIQNNTVDWHDVPGCQIEARRLADYQLKNGDILVARTGGTIGKSYLVVDLAISAVFASYLIRIIPVNLIYGHYLKLFMETPSYWAQLLQMVGGTGQPNVNASALKLLILPLPSLTEQRAIVERVDRLLALVDELAAQVAERKAQADALMQAVLREAFAG